jgi:type II secretory pathway component PulF
MISTAEESGSLAPVTARVADYYEQQLMRRLKTFSKMAEPIMLLVMGGVVGVLVSSLILPIFKLSRAVA